MYTFSQSLLIIVLVVSPYIGGWLIFRYLNKKEQTMNEPKEMVLRGFNKHYRFILYECPTCEGGYGNAWFIKNKLRPGEIFTCDDCGTKLKVPEYDIKRVDV